MDDAENRIPAIQGTCQKEDPLFSYATPLCFSVELWDIGPPQPYAQHSAFYDKGCQDIPWLVVYGLSLHRVYLCCYSSLMLVKRILLVEMIRASLTYLLLIS